MNFLLMSENGKKVVVNRNSFVIIPVLIRKKGKGKRGIKNHWL